MGKYSFDFPLSGDCEHQPREESVQEGTSPTGWFDKDRDLIIPPSMTRNQYLGLFDKNQYKLWPNLSTTDQDPNFSRIFSQLLQVNPPKFEKCEDMSNLTYLNEVNTMIVWKHDVCEQYTFWFCTNALNVKKCTIFFQASVLHNLRSRYQAKLIYVSSKNFSSI